MEASATIYSKKYRSSTLQIYFNPVAMEMINMREVEFSPRKLTIKEPNIDTQKTFVIDDCRSLTFGAKGLELEEIIGEYEVDEIREGEFQLIKKENAN